MNDYEISIMLKEVELFKKYYSTPHEIMRAILYFRNADKAFRDYAKRQAKFYDEALKVAIENNSY